jgi:hypothetical protein
MDHDGEHDGAHVGAHEHHHAGQGAVLLDIGGDVGALVVHMPAELIGVEVEICPLGEARDERHRPHVAVVARPAGTSAQPTLVFPAVREGSYELYRRPDGATALIATVRGGEVTEEHWPP